MPYPLFDANFTLWAADLDSRLMDRHGITAKRLGVELRHLMERFYAGESVQAAASTIAQRFALA